jgi:hypothetical protein
MIQKFFCLLSLFFAVSCSSTNESSTCSNFYQNFPYARPASWNSIHHIVVVFLENTPYSQAINLPYQSQLATTGAALVNSYGVSRPSQPNYIAFTSGDTQEVSTNDPVNLNVTNLADLLDATGKSWKLYAQSYPGNCNLSTSIGPYVRKHTPFLNYTNITSVPTRCAKITNETEFDYDIQNLTLPDFSIFIPDDNFNGHDTGPSYADSWLQSKFNSILSNASITNNTLFIFTYDEGGDPAHGDLNHIYTVFYGAGIRIGSSEVSCINHYGVLSTIEDIFHLGNLGRNDVQATRVLNIWR